MTIIKNIRLVLILSILISFSFGTEKNTGVTSCESPLANGILKLQVRNDSVKFMCQEIKVRNGVFQACDTHSLASYTFYIHRQKINSEWLVDPIKLNDFFPKTETKESNTKWFNFEYKKSYNHKEDFTSDQQKTGVTYRHHESKKNFVNYVIANPKEKPYSNESKYQFQYDWEENIKGKYESFYGDGTKRFRHKYLATRFMALDKKANSKEQQSNCDITLSGVIESFYETGKKKEVVIYNDLYITEQKPKKERITIKSERTGERKTFYESGKLFSSGKFNFKGYQGEVIYFSLKKIIIKSTNYKDDLLHGKYKEFNEDNTIKTKGQYISGKKSGKWQYFDLSGKKTSTIQF